MFGLMHRSPIRIEVEPESGSALHGALALSLLTGRSLEARAASSASGNEAVQAQIRAALKAARAVGGLPERRDAPLLFEPESTGVRPGDYLLELGDLGRAIPMLALPLALANRPSTLRLLGATHGTGSPGHPYLAAVWLPTMAELGFDLSMELKSAGFEPDGGGELVLEVRPAREPIAFDRRTRGTLREARVQCAVSNLDFRAARRASARALQRLRESGICAEAENLPIPSQRSTGCACLVTAAFERTRVGFGACAVVDGEEGAERLADDVSRQLVWFVESRAALDARGACGLILPLALGAAGLRGGERTLSRFTVSDVSRELVALAQIVGRFLDVEVAILARADEEAEIRIAPAEEGLLERLRGATSA